MKFHGDSESGKLQTKVLRDVEEIVRLLEVYFYSGIGAIIGIIFAKLFDILYGKFKVEDYKKISKFQLFLEILFHLFLIGVVAYILRNIVGLIPYPLDGVAGFRHARLKELSGGTVLAMVLLFFQRNLRDKLTFFADTVFGIKNPPEKAEELEPPSNETED
jgi:hypothetical protein